jgi:hypothetical protein
MLCIILCFAYIRLKYKFWTLQPVFHFYDIYYWFINVGVIRKELPERNRYVNLKKIITKRFEEIDELTLKELVLLIRLNYLRNGENIFSPTKENIVPYFVGHNTKTYWSYFVEPELLIDNKIGKTIEENLKIGIITSRPLHVKINNGRKDAIFDVYYVDYLCINKGWRKKNIAPQMIQTHEYNQSHDNRKICVSLFKREEELTGIIPLTVYKTYCFNMKNWGHPEQLEHKINVLTGDKQNMYYLYNFINGLTKNEITKNGLTKNEMTKNEMTKDEMTKNEMTNKWDIIIYPEISNLIELVTTKNLFIKMLVIDGNIEAVYIFRKTCTFIEKDKEILSCIASVNGTNLKKNDFIKGFKSVLWSIIEEHRNFGYLVIEDISDNTCIINNICLRTHPLVVSPSAYFFYNFAYSPFKSEKCLIIN